MKGALLANPMLVINMGCEMIYIIDHRLKAQGIDRDKSITVLNDMIINLFSEQLLPQMFKPAPCYNGNFLFQLFQKLAHCSIMKLNAESMSKLFDLTLMTTKLHLLQSNSPFEIFAISKTHFHHIEKIPLNDISAQALNHCRFTFEKEYKSLSPFDFVILRQVLLKFFAGKFTKVQLFLNDGSQNCDGTFNLKISRKAGCGVEVPGTLQVPEDGGLKTQLHLEQAEGFKLNHTKSPFEDTTELGQNNYDALLSAKQSMQYTANEERGNTSESSAKHNFQQEINKLSSIISKRECINEDIVMFQSDQQANQNPKQLQVQQHQGERLDNDGFVIQFSQNKSLQAKQDILDLFKNLEQESHIQEQQSDEEVDLLDLMDQT